MLAQVIVGGIILLIVVSAVGYMAKGIKHGTSDSDPEKHKALKKFCDGEHPQQKYYKNLVNQTVENEENIDKTIEKNRSDK